MYKDMFKPSQNCRAPHLNVDTLRDELHRARVIDRADIASPEDLVKWLLAANTRVQAKVSAQDPSALGPQAKKALEKAEKYGFFLGLDSAWIREGALGLDDRAGEAADVDDE